MLPSDTKGIADVHPLPFVVADWETAPVPSRAIERAIIVCVGVIVNSPEMFQLPLFSRWWLSTIVGSRKRFTSYHPI